MSIHDALREFHLAMEVPTFDTPSVPSTERVQLRARILAEESVLEHMEAIGCNEYLISECRDLIEKTIGTARREFTNIVLVADSLADTIYVAAGSNLEYGIPGHEVFGEVHAANMRKAGGPKRADGKVLKPPGWRPPNIEGVLRRAGWKG